MYGRLEWVGGAGGGGGVWLGGKEEGRRRGVGVGCVGMGGVCGGRREGEGGGRGGNRQHRTSELSQAILFFLAWIVTFTELEKF